MNLGVDKHLDAEAKKVKQVADKYRSENNCGCGPVITKQLPKCTECGQYFEPTNGNQKRCPKCRWASNKENVQKAEPEAVTMLEEEQKEEIKMDFKIEYDVELPLGQVDMESQPLGAEVVKFIQSDHKTMAMTFDTEDKAKNRGAALRRFIKRKGYNITITQRKNKVWVVRKDEQDDKNLHQNNA